MTERNANRPDVYSRITDKIIVELEQGQARDLSFCRMKTLPSSSRYGIASPPFATSIKLPSASAKANAASS